MRPARSSARSAGAAPDRPRSRPEIGSKELDIKTDWRSANHHLSQAINTYRHAAPEVAGAFSGLAQAATRPGALDPKTKELIALAIGIAGRCDGCVGFHTQAAIRHGASRDEILDTIGVAVYMGGGPSYVYGAQALQAFDQLSSAQPAPVLRPSPPGGS